MTQMKTDWMATVKKAIGLRALDVLALGQGNKSNAHSGVVLMDLRRRRRHT